MPKTLKTVKELRQELEKYPEDWPVMVLDGGSDVVIIEDCEALVFGDVNNPKDTVVLFPSKI